MSIIYRFQNHVLENIYILLTWGIGSHRLHHTGSPVKPLLSSPEKLLLSSKPPPSRFVLKDQDDQGPEERKISARNRPQ